MSALTTAQLVAVAVYSMTGLVWAIVAQDTWRFLRWRFLVVHDTRARPPRSQLSRLLPVLTACMAFLYFQGALLSLLPVEIHARRPAPLVLVLALRDIGALLSIAMFRHLALLLPLREQRPRPSWLMSNYGPAILLGLVDLFPGLVPAPTWETRTNVLRVVYFSYAIVMLALTLRQMSRFARRGIWRPGGLGEARSADVVMFGAGLVGLTVLFVAVVRDLPHPAPDPIWLVCLIAGLGLVLAMPFAVRMLGELVRRLLITLATVGTTALIYVGVHRFAAPHAGAELRPILDLAAVFLPVLILVPGQASLRSAIDQLLFRRSHRRRAELHKFLHTLSPEAGTIECCRRMLAEVTRVMQLRGAAILLNNGAAVVHGTLAVDPLRRVWPSGAPADFLPPRAFAAGTFRELPVPLQEALIDADVVGVVPVISPRRHWGYAFITAGALRATFSDEDIQAMQTLADQFALVLDATELLARTVAVERSLAHAEKLAVIGELAARIAHDIRNPVAAARSLAQQLCQDPQAAYAAEHQLILTELDRIERQVTSLLRFARREQFEFGPVDLSDLARGTVAAFRPRLEAAGITVDLDVRDGVVARADREKIRQVLINLIDNAMDALHETHGRKQLHVAVTHADGTGTLRVSDNGPGVPAEALPHLFEPFFSLKPSGTGLGLAIAKRTVDAHGGRIEAAPSAGTGMTFRIDLPLASVEESPEC